MCVTGWRKRHQSFVLRQRLIAAAALSCVGFAPSRSYSEGTPNKDGRIALKDGCEWRPKLGHPTEWPRTVL
jgi:hypothetical protein